MKKHNGHSNGHVASKTRSVSPGLQATLAMRIAETLAQSGGGSSTARGVVVRSYRSGLDASPGATKGRRTSAGIATDTVGPSGVGTDAALDDMYIKVMAGSNTAAANAPHAGNIAIGSAASALGNVAQAMGYLARANGTGVLAVGDQAAALADFAVGIGYQANASGGGDVALGYNAQTSGNDAIAIGDAAVASVNDAIAIGSQINVHAVNTIAFGSNFVTVDSASSTSFLVAPNARGGLSNSSGAVALLGRASNASNSVAIGSGSNVQAASAVALGNNASVTGSNSVALGANASATRNNAVAVGNTAANGQRQIVNMGAGTDTTDAVNVGQLSPVVTALGGGAGIDPTTGAVSGPIYTLQNGGPATTVGGALAALDTALSSGGANNKYFAIHPGSLDLGAEVFPDGALAIGSNAYASATDSVAIGNNTLATERSTFAIGAGGGQTRRLVHMTAGTAATDAVNVSQLSPVVTALGGGAAIDPATGAVTPPSFMLDGLPTQTTVAGALSVLAQAVGDSAQTPYLDVNSTGPDAAAGGSNAIALGSSTSASGNFAIAIGYNAKTNTGGSSYGLGNVVIGSNALVANTGAGAIAIGRNAKINVSAGESYVTGAGSIALGDGALVYGNRATAIGISSYAGHTGSVALGDGARVLSTGPSVALGSGAVADEVSTISIGNKSTGFRHRVVNMDAGLSAYEAVNVNQLQPALTALDAAFDASTGAVTGPTYTLVNGGTQTTVGGALSALDKAVSDALAASDPYLAVNSTGAAASATGSDAIGLGSGTQASGSNAVAIGANAVANLPDTVSVGNPGGERKIVNAAAATLTVTSTDVVIGSQLYDTNLQLSDLQGEVANLTGPVTLAVTYQNASKTAIVLGAGQAATITNLAPATQGSGAVNLTQMTGAIDALRGELGGVLPYVKVNSTGVDAIAAGEDAVAIGSAAVASIEGSVALGVRARASVAHGVALGSDSLADMPLTVSVGSSASGLTRRVVNLQPGLGASDAVSVSQLSPALAALGAGFDTSTGAVTGPTYTLVNGGTQTTVSGALSALDQAVSASAQTPYLRVNSTGPDAAAGGSNAIALGSSTSAVGNASTAIGQSANAAGGGDVAVGLNASTSGFDSIAIGDTAVASRDDAIAIGSQINVGAINTIALGSNFVTVDSASSTSFLVAPNNVGGLSSSSGAVALLGSATNANNSVAIGWGSNVRAAAAVALGNNATVTGTSSVALGANASATRNNAVAVGNTAANGQRQIVNMLAGTETTDAVNVGQLSPALAALGAGFDTSTGAVTGPTYTLVNGGTQTTVSGALSALDQAIGESAGNNPYLAINSTGADASAVGNDAIGLGSGTSAVGNNSVAIGANSIADIPDTVSVGGLGYKRKIVNVAPGDVSPTSVDAINGTQLYVSNQLVNQLHDTLFTSGLIDPGTRTSLAVTYSNASKNIIYVGSLGTPAEIMNVADGLVSSDAATVGQVTNAVSALRTELSKNLNYVKVNSTGTNAVASGTNAVAIGSNASSATAGSVAIGTGSDANGLRSVAIGYNSSADEDNTVSVGYAGGERRIVNVADGRIEAGGTDAINGGQLFDALGALGTRAGILDVTDPLAAIEGVTGDNTASLNGNDPTTYTAMAFGVKSLASGANTAAFGLNNTAGFDNSVAIGVNSGTGADQPYSVAIGSKAVTRGQQAIALGANVAANADYAVAVGTNTTQALGVSSIAIGDSAKDRGVSGVAIGKTASVLAGATSCIAIGTSTTVAANLSNAIALGTSASVVAGSSGGVALGQGAVANRGNAVSLGATTGSSPVGTRQIINLSAGTVGTDAVNVTQLLGVTTALGGGATIGTDGSIVPPSYAVGGTSYTNVGAALNAVANMTDPNAVSYDDAAKGTVTLDGTSGTRLTNLSAGTVSNTSTDAINGAQLFGTAQSVATGLGGGAAVNTDGTVASPLYVIGSTMANNVGAALSNLYTAVEGQLADSGLIDASSGQAIAAVTYDSASQTLVSLGGTSATNPVRVTNAAAGSLSASSSDVVNGAQLFQTNQEVGDLKSALDGISDASGQVLAVIYADATKADINLGNAGTPVKITNAAAGTLSPASTDTVNGSQLFATNQAVNNVTTVVNNSGIVDQSGASLAVIYVDATKRGIDLGNAGIPVTVSNVAAGDVSTTSTDAVNGAQLNQTNLAVTQLADALDNAVTYTDESKTDVVLGTGGTPVSLQNVAAGTSTSDAVNVSQLQGIASALGGGTRLGADGSIIPPSYSVDGTTYTDVGAAIVAVASMAGTDPNAVSYDDTAKDTVTLDGADGTLLTNLSAGSINATSMDAVNGSQLYATNQAVTDVADALDDLTASGLVDPTTRELLALVYDDNAKDSVTLGGATATAAVPLHNLATGTAGTDGVNVTQLTQGLSDLRTELTSGAINLKYIKVNATGTQANANGTNAVSIGSNASATSVAAVAIGTGASVAGNRSVAVGYNSYADEDDVCSVGFAGGERKIINVADGDVSPASTDAVTGGQLYAVRRALDALTKNGVKDVTDPLAAIEGRSGNNVASLNGGDPEASTAAAIGVFSVASGANAIAMGLHNVAGSDHSVALGRMAHTGADHEYSVAVGGDVRTNASRAVAFGVRVQANAEHALALGTNDTWAIGKSSIAMGDGVKVRSDNSIAIGRSAMVAANANHALALGAEASVAGDAIGSVALGHGAVADRGNAISIGGGTVGSRQIIHVAAGTDDDDAVNVKQLRDVVASLMAEIQTLRGQLGARAAG